MAIRISSEIKPLGDYSTSATGVNAYPTHIDEYGKGGFVALDTNGNEVLSEINKLVPYLRRKEGMLVYDTHSDDYYRCIGIGSSVADGTWQKEYFAGRYFYGATSPTATDIQLGEKWFDTVVGSEYTYLPIADGSSHYAWIDIDHLGFGLTVDNYVNIEGDVMTGTLTGPFAAFTQGMTASNGFIGTLTGTNVSFTNLTASNGFIGTLTGTNASFVNLTATNGLVGTLTADRGFRGSETGFVDNEFITKEYADFKNSNILINGNFSVWQRGDAFRYLQDGRIGNPVKRQIGFNYYNFRHNTNLLTPHTRIVRGLNSTNFNSVFYAACADRWHAGWTLHRSNSNPGLTGEGFYVYRGFANKTDQETLKHSNNFLRISNSPPFNSSPYQSREHIKNGRIVHFAGSPPLSKPIKYTNVAQGAAGTLSGVSTPEMLSAAAGYGNTNPTGITFGAMWRKLFVERDIPIGLSAGTADIFRCTDVQYVGMATDPYNTCKPISLSNYSNNGSAMWAGFFYPTIHGQVSHLKFGTPDAKSIKLEFYARSSITGSYYVALRNTPYESIQFSGASGTRSCVSKYQIDQTNTWKKYSIIFPGDTVNTIQGDSLGLTGIWLDRRTKSHEPSLTLVWTLGTTGSYLTSTTDSWVYGTKFASTDATNLFSVTGNYFDIAEVSLVAEETNTNPYFEDYLTELQRCKYFYQTSSVYNSFQQGGAAVVFPNTFGAHSSNELNLNLESSMRPGIFGSELIGGTGERWALPIYESHYTSMFNAIVSSSGSGLHPASGAFLGWTNAIDVDAFWGPSLNTTPSGDLNGYYIAIADSYLHGHGSTGEMLSLSRIAYGPRVWGAPHLDPGRGNNNCTTSTRLPLGTNSTNYSTMITTKEINNIMINWSAANTSDLDKAFWGSYSIDGEPYFFSWAYIKPYELSVDDAVGGTNPPLDNNW